MATPKVRQFAGDIRLWRKNANGSLTPVIAEPTDPDGNQPIETNTLQFSYEAGEENVVVSKRRGARYNQPVYQDTLPGVSSISMELLEIPPIMLARAMFGESTEATVAAGTVTEADFTIVTKDRPLQLPHRMLDDSVPFELQSNDLVTTYVEGTDYTVDYRRGQVLILAAGIAVDAVLKASYEYLDHVTNTIIGGATPTESFYITGDLNDRVNEEDGELTIYEARMTVDGEVDWLSTTPINVTLVGTIVVPDDQDEPYKWVQYKAAA